MASIAARRQIPSDEEARIDLTPMLDVVFIMLIFFLVTANFIRETGIDVNRSPDNLVEQTVSTGILVTIDEHNRIFIEGRDTDPRALAPNLLRLHSERPDARVIIRPDPRSRTEALVQALDAGRSVGIVDIAVASIGGPGGER